MENQFAVVHRHVLSGTHIRYAPGHVCFNAVSQCTTKNKISTFSLTDNNSATNQKVFSVRQRRAQWHLYKNHVPYCVQEAVDLMTLQLTPLTAALF